MSRQQRTVRFSGNVQGVGFRYTTVRTAERFDVDGYVRNMSDGRVEIVAEGESDQIDAFIDAVTSRMSAYISDSEQTTGEAEGKFAGFNVKF